MERTTGDVNVEAVELCCWRESASEVEQPDSVGMRSFRAMILFGGKATQMADVTESA